MDGTPTLRMNEFAVGSLALGKADLGPPMSESTGTCPSLLLHFPNLYGTTGTDLPHPEELVFTINEQVRTHIRLAQEKFDALVADHELHVRIRLSPFLPLTHLVFPFPRFSTMKPTALPTLKPTNSHRTHGHNSSNNLPFSRCMAGSGSRTRVHRPGNSKKGEQRL